VKSKSLRELVAAYERMVVSQTLLRNGGDKGKTAVALGVTRRGLDKLLIRHRLTKPRYTRPIPIGRVDDDREG
jgi:DNA-binding NtrC family response regulator